MLNKPSLPQLRSDKRFDALIRQQMTEHQHLICCHHKEMQELRDSLKLATEKIESLYQLSDQRLKDFEADVANHLYIMKKKAIEDGNSILNFQKSTSDIYDQLSNFHEMYATKDYVKREHAKINSNIQNVTNNQLIFHQEFQKEMKDIFDSLKQEISDIRSVTNRNFEYVHHKMDKNFDLSIMDKEGVLKEIRVYEKTVFIIEKKIENLYTLIERLTKRIESCHKPE